jgi:hypothetical protein
MTAKRNSVYAIHQVPIAGLLYKVAVTSTHTAFFAAVEGGLVACDKD